MADDEDVQPLVAQLRRGDPEALVPLFARYRGALRRMIDFRLDHRLNGRVSTSDVLQDAYIDAMTRVGHYLEKPEMPIFVWLRLITAQRLVDVHRLHLGAQRRAVSQEVSLDGAGAAGATSTCLARYLAANHSSPSEAVIREERVAQIEDVLNAMDPIDREVLALRHFEELSNHETAEVLGIERAAASKRYVRALVRLKEALSKLPGMADVE